MSEYSSRIEMEALSAANEFAFKLSSTIDVKLTSKIDVKLNYFRTSSAKYKILLNERIGDVR